MLNFDRFHLLTFDCYGTLIDWESGILSVLHSILAAHNKSMPDPDMLELYGELEAQAEKGTYATYREVLRSVVRGFGKNLGFIPTPAEENALPESLANWLPFSDTVEALSVLKHHYKLAIISNIDDDLFSLTAPKLSVKFEEVTTAQQAHCYKPCLEIFQLAQRRSGMEPQHWLHVGQSIYHDVIPAQSLGISTVWVNRASPRVGVGAVKPASGRPDLEVPDLRSLARLAAASA